jgi:hypothetical protein
MQEFFVILYFDTAFLHCKQDPINAIQEIKLRCLVPNFHIHVSVGDLYIPTIGPPILLQQNRWIILRIYTVNPSQIPECKNWERGRAVSFLGIHKSDLVYCVTN